ncbi:uncharacterized protein LOC126828343 [Patella vulgata]|uniref:uncharacterized protein LOC126828343 n=1 Tax=Patella vulgata TaxID=6465 RepID=UPI00217FFA7E|nr:uncharacterized protein LOC126828343 [Patella vulgata]
MLAILHIVILLVIPIVNGFRNGENIQGASEQLYCGREPLRRLPFHASERCDGACAPQTDDPPYRIVLESDESTYWDDDVRISLVTIDEDSNWRVNGFSIFALDTDDKIVGAWAPDDIVQLTCGSSAEGMTAVHAVADSTRTRVNVRWTPAGRNLGNVTFRAVVVHSLSLFWSIASDRTLFPARTGEDIIDIATHFDELINDTLVGDNIDLEHMPSIDLFEKTFTNRFESGWDPEDLFGAFNRDVTMDDFYFDNRREGTFTSPFGGPSTRFGENQPDSIVNRFLNGGFPGMSPPSSMFGQSQNGWNPMGAFGNTNQQQNTPPWMQGFPGMQNNMQGGMNMWGNNQQFGQNNMQPGMQQNNNMFGNNQQFGQNNMQQNQQNPFQNFQQMPQNNMFANRPQNNPQMPGGMFGNMPQGLPPGMGGPQGVPQNNMFANMPPGMGGPQGIPQGMGGQQGMFPGMSGNGMMPGMQMGMQPGVGIPQGMGMPQGLGGTGFGTPQGLGGATGNVGTPPGIALGGPPGAAGGPTGATSSSTSIFALFGRK